MLNIELKHLMIIKKNYKNLFNKLYLNTNNDILFNRIINEIIIDNNKIIELCLKIKIF